MRREESPGAIAWRAAELQRGPGSVREESERGGPGVSLSGGDAVALWRLRQAAGALSRSAGSVRERDAWFLEKSRGRRIIAG